MTAAARIAALDSLPADELCTRAETTLAALVDVMNQETTLLRAGHVLEAGRLTPEKARLSQDYVTLSRSVQRQIERLKAEAPERIERLRNGHERLATQMAENLRVLASARTVARDLMNDVARKVGQTSQPRIYGDDGMIGAHEVAPAAGLALNRAS